MYRQIIGYVPSVIVPAFISMAMVYVYTRLLTPAAFGSYTFVFSAVLVLQTSLFFALPMTVMRFYPQAAVAGRQDRFLKQAYALFYAMAGVTIVLGVGIGLLVDCPRTVPPGRLAGPAAAAVPVTGPAQPVGQSLHQQDGAAQHDRGTACRPRFWAGAVALSVLGHGPEAIILGLLVAAIVCAGLDFRLLGAPFRPAPAPSSARSCANWSITPGRWSPRRRPRSSCRTATGFGSGELW